MYGEVHVFLIFPRALPEYGQNELSYNSLELFDCVKFGKLYL
jgi:hypothetical protein